MQRSYHAATAWAAEGRFQQGRQQASCSGQQHPACTHALACAPPRLVMDCRIWRTVIGPSAATQPEEYFIVKSDDPRLSSRLQATDIALKMHFSMQAPSAASQRATCGYLSCNIHGSLHLQSCWSVRNPSSVNPPHPSTLLTAPTASLLHLRHYFCKLHRQYPLNAMQDFSTSRQRPLSSFTPDCQCIVCVCIRSVCMVCVRQCCLHYLDALCVQLGFMKKAQLQLVSACIK